MRTGPYGVLLCTVRLQPPSVLLQAQCIHPLVRVRLLRWLNPCSALTERCKDYLNNGPGSLDPLPAFPGPVVWFSYPT